MNENKKMLSIREVAKTGIISEYALRLMVAQGVVPVTFVGRKALINYSLLEDILSSRETITISTHKEVN